MWARAPGLARATSRPQVLGRAREVDGRFRRLGTHDSTFRLESPRGSSGRLASVGRAYYYYYYYSYLNNTKRCPFHVRDCSLRLSSSSGSGSFLSPTSPSLSLSRLCLLPQRVIPGLTTSLWRPLAPLRWAGGGSPQAPRGTQSTPGP